ncbi:MAG: nucleotide sugar dehydrogenase [Firmicutes bacterium]|nr:nucleotide sugar dehydrogenase [Bacillota bacterium]
MAVLKGREEHPEKVLKEKIFNRSAKVAVIGLGYVGLPLAAEQAKIGFSVVGIDKDLRKVEQINQGKSYIRDVSDDVLSALVENGSLRATGCCEPLKEADIIIICVPTPLKSMRQPDLSFVISAAREVAGQIRTGQLISLESTTFPGTTQEVVLPILESAGLTVGKDFFLAFSPERVDPGNRHYTAREISKVVGGVTPLCRDVACAFYSQSLRQVVPVSSPAAAEMTKIFENTYRSVNIALVNEFMILCDRMGIDVWEVVEAAALNLAQHSLPYYAQELATALHAFYDTDECRVLTEDRALSQARLKLVAACKTVLANTLALIGVRAPEQM